MISPLILSLFRICYFLVASFHKQFLGFLEHKLCQNSNIQGGLFAFFSLCKRFPLSTLPCNCSYADTSQDVHTGSISTN